MEITEAHRAANLPELWDRLALDYFQTRGFLEHTEKYNPCKQRYYMLFQNGILITGLVMYTILWRSHPSDSPVIQTKTSKSCTRCTPVLTGTGVRGFQELL